MCASLIALLRSQNMLPYFKCICVDNNLANLPKEITRVPTVIIPSLRKQLVADQIFQWIQTLRENKQQAKTATTQPILPTSTKPIGPIGFIKTEMAGLSDTYAYTNVDTAPQHTYIACDEVGKNQIFTAPEQDRITINTQKTYIDTLNIQRKSQDREISKVLDIQKQGAHIINSKIVDRDKLMNTIVEQQQQKIANMYQ